MLRKRSKDAMLTGDDERLVNRIVRETGATYGEAAQLYVKYSDIPPRQRAEVVRAELLKLPGLVTAKDGLIPLPKTSEERAQYKAGLEERIKKLRAGAVRGQQPEDLSNAEEQLRRLAKDAAPFVENHAMTDLAEKVQRLFMSAPNTREGIDAAKVEMRKLIAAAGTTPEKLAQYVTRMATSLGRRVNVNHLKNLARDANPAQFVKRPLFKVGQTVTIPKATEGLRSRGLASGSAAPITEVFKQGKGQGTEFRYKIKGLWVDEELLEAGGSVNDAADECECEAAHCHGARQCPSPPVGVFTVVGMTQRLCASCLAKARRYAETLGETVKPFDGKR